MGLLQSLVDGFIVTMGITPPSPQKRRLATIYIASALIVSVLAVLALFGFLLSRIV